MTDGPADADPALRMILESDLADLDRRLETAHSAYRRHVVWMLLGLSPGAVIPALLALSEWGAGALVAVIGAVFVLESARALAARRAIGALRRERLAVLEELEAVVAGRQGDVPNGGHLA